MCPTKTTIKAYDTSVIFSLTKTKTETKIIDFRLRKLKLELKLFDN
jgi:hypothetical protein